MLHLICTLAASVFLVTLDFVMLIPLSPVIAEQTGLGIANAGLLISMYPILAIFSGLLIAPFSDRWGRKKILMILMVGLIFSSILAALSSSATAILVARALAGLFAGIVMPTAIAFAGDAYKSTARAKAVTWVLLSIPLASTLGVPLMAWIASVLSWQQPFYIVASCATLIFLLICKLPNIDPNTKKQDISEQYKELFALWLDKPIRLLLLLEFLLVFAVYGLVPHIGAWLSLNYALDTLQIGMYFLVGGLGAVTGNLIASYFVRQGARLLPILLGSLVLVLFIVIATQEWLSAFYISGLMFFIMLGDASRYPAIQVMLTEAVPIALRGRLLLMNIIVTNLAMALGGLWSSLFVVELQQRLIGLDKVGLSVILITLLLCYLLIKLRGQHQSVSAYIAPAHSQTSL